MAEDRNTSREEGQQWHLCHVMWTASPVVPLNSLGQDDQNEVQNDSTNSASELLMTPCTLYTGLKIYSMYFGTRRYGIRAWIFILNITVLGLHI